MRLHIRTLLVVMLFIFTAVFAYDVARGLVTSATVTINIAPILILLCTLGIIEAIEKKG